MSDRPAKVRTVVKYTVDGEERTSTFFFRSSAESLLPVIRSMADSGSITLNGEKYSDQSA